MLETINFVSFNKGFFNHFENVCKSKGNFIKYRHFLSIVLIVFYFYSNVQEFMLFQNNSVFVD